MSALKNIFPRLWKRPETEGRRNGWLDSKRSIKRKSSHCEENAYVFFVKN